MYPFVATWFARCAELKDVDLSFMKVITVGGGILDPTTADLLKKKIPHIKIVRVCIFKFSYMFILSKKINFAFFCTGLRNDRNIGYCEYSC